MIYEDQNMLIGYVLNLQATIGRGRRDEEIENQVGTIWEGIRMAKHINKQGAYLALQAKGGMDKIKSRTLSEAAVINDDLQSTIAVVKKINHDKKRRMESINN